MSFAADDLRNTIEAGWTLTGVLSKTSSDTMKEIVRFFSRPQIMGSEVTKAIEVVKTNSLENQNVIEHPNFSEKTDIFRIKVRFRVLDVQEITYNDALTNIEDMQDEVIRIIQTVFNPSTTTGTFSTTNRNWNILDNVNTAQPDLIREMDLRLTEIVSEDPAVFRGFGGVLVFDTSASIGDSKPSSNYEYEAVFNVRLEEGFATIPVLTNDDTRGIGVPTQVRGIFSGRFSAEMYAKRQDLDGATIDKLDNIYKTQSNGELPTIVFLHAHTNTELTPRTMTSTTIVKVTRLNRFEVDDGLVTFTVIGTVLQPTIYEITT